MLNVRLLRSHRIFHDIHYKSCWIKTRGLVLPFCFSAVLGHDQQIFLKALKPLSRDEFFSALCQSFSFALRQNGNKNLKLFYRHCVRRLKCLKGVIKYSMFDPSLNSCYQGLIKQTAANSRRIDSDKDQGRKWNFKANPARLVFSDPFHSTLLHW